jgi:thioredoxin reductase (NADPH)
MVAVVMEIYDIIVIGGGPAGLSAAIYSSRANQKTLVLDNEGCLNYKIGWIGNYLGFPNGIDGNELIKLGCQQVRALGSTVKIEEALAIKINSNGNYMVETNKDTYQAKGIIIATGVTHKKVNIENLEKFEGKGISYCVICDGFFFKNKKVAIVGSKNYAAREAIELTNYSNDIILFTNGEKIEIDSNFIKNLEENEIEIVNDKIARLVGDKVLTGIELEKGKIIKIDGLFIAIGSSGTVDLARKIGIIIENNYIKVDDKEKTNLPRIYAAGDCTGGNRQIATAVGEGANAALNLISELKGATYIDYKKKWG